VCHRRKGLEVGAYPISIIQRGKGNNSAPARPYKGGQLHTPREEQHLSQGNMLSPRPREMLLVSEGGRGGRKAEPLPLISDASKIIDPS